MTKWLVISCFVIFLLHLFTLPAGRYFSALQEWGAFSVSSGLLGGHVWELLTFQFLHGSLGHVGFNCLALWLFGPFVERWWGSARFLGFYLLTGVAGALFFTFLLVAGLLPRSSLDTPLIGASAGIYGIIVAVAVINPQQRLSLIFPPVEMSMRTAALFWIGIAVFTILGALVFAPPVQPGSADLFRNSGGEAGHLGGALLGWLFMRFPRLLGKGDSSGAAHQPGNGRKKSPSSPILRPRTSLDLERTSQVDAILDKISTHGFQSLTQEERDVLARASRSSDRS